MLVLQKLRFVHITFMYAILFLPVHAFTDTLSMIVQEGVAIEVAEAVVGALKGELSATAVNAPMVPAEVHAFSIYQLSPSIIHISEGG